MLGKMERKYKSMMMIYHFNRYWSFISFVSVPNKGGSLKSPQLQPASPSLQYEEIKMTKKNDKRYVEKKMEWDSRSFNYSQFDDLLKTDFGGDITDMYEYILESEEQFEEKFQHDQFINDFINWMKNRKITLHE